MTTVGIVTGAGRGMGAACAELLSDVEQPRVRVPQTGDELVAALAPTPSNALLVTSRTRPAVTDSRFAACRYTTGDGLARQSPARHPAALARGMRDAYRAMSS